jgi:hypothetical protein
MKALAGRTRDIDDLRALADLVGIDTVESAIAVCADFFPDESIAPRALGVLHELFGANG